MAKISITTHPTIAHLFAILILLLAAGMSFCASAYTMPADKLMALSNKELCDKAWSHWQASQLDSALICYSIVANRTDSKQSRDDMRRVAMANANIGSIYLSDFYDYGRAMQYFLKAEDIAKKNQLNKQLAQIYYSMAVVENYKNDVYNDFAFNPQAFQLFQKSFKMAVEQDAPSTQVQAVISLIICAARNGKLELIIQEMNTYLSQAINDTIQARDFARCLCMTSIHLTEGDYEEALKELSKLETSLNVDKVIIPQYLSIAYQCKYYFYREMGDEKSALQQLNTMEHFGLEHDIKECVIEALFHKCNFYQKTGNLALAKEYEAKYLKAKDKFLLETKMAKADEEKVLFQLNEANHEIKELSYKQRIQQTELIAVVVVAVLLLALLVLAWLSHRRIKQKNQSLYDRNQQLLVHVDHLRQIRKELEQQAQETEITSAATIKYGRGKMEHNDIAQVMEKVERAMDTSPEIFSTEFSLDQLVELTGESRPRLSQALNEVPNRSFYSILNEYRVREACRRMNDKEHYSDLTIEAVGQSVGFKSRSNFVSTFKRIVGLTPSAYLKQVGLSTAQPPSNDSSDTSQAESL